MSENNVFISGGAGFIGSSLIQVLKPHFENIYIYDRSLNSGPPRQQTTVHGSENSITYIRGDVCDYEALAAALRRSDPKVIIHLAAETGTSESLDKISGYCSVNVQGTANLVEAIRELPREQSRKVILASSRAVYGEGGYRSEDDRIVNGNRRSLRDLASGRFEVFGVDGKIMIPTSTPETLPPAPDSIYASTKLMQEYLLSQAFSGTNIVTTILRLQNVYGPNQAIDNPYTGILPFFASAIIANEKVSVYEDGRVVRDFVHVSDVCRAFLLSAQSSSGESHIINIGSGEPCTLIRAATLFLSYLGKGTECYHVTGQFRSGDIRHALADVRKAKEILDWEPTIGLAEGFKEFANLVAGRVFRDRGKRGG